MDVLGGVKQQRGWAFSLFILVIGIFFSTAMAFWSYQSEKNQLKFRYEKLAMERIHVIEQSLFEGLSVLDAIHAFYDASQFVDQTEFHIFVEPYLEKKSFVRSLQWAPLVRDSPSGKESFPLSYQEPQSSEEQNLTRGDLSADPLMQELFDNARRSGKLIFSPRVRQEKEAGYGIFGVQPIYKKGVSLKTVEERYQALEGFILACYRVGHLVESALSIFQTEGIHMTLYDVTDPLDAQLLYDYRSRAGPATVNPLKPRVELIKKSMAVSKKIQIGGRTWEVLSTSYIPKWAVPFKWLLTVEIAGLLFTGMVVGYMRILSQRAREKEKLVLALSQSNVRLKGEIKEREKIEKELEEKGARYQNIFNHSNDAIFLFDLQGHVVDANEQALAEFGYTRGEIKQKSLPNLHPEYTHSRVRDSVGKLVREGFVSLEVDFLKKNGEIFPGWISAKRLELNGEILLQGIVRNITELKETQKKLSKEKEFSERIVESNVDGVVATDTQFNITIWNPGMERITGIPKEMILGKNALECLPFLKETGEEAILKQAMAGEFKRSFASPFHIPQTNKKGFFDGVYSPIRNDAGGVIGGVAIIRDVTEHKKMEEQLFQTQKMESLGQLAGGIAHDFNNLIAVMSGYADILLSQNVAPEQEKKYIEEIKKTTQQAANMTRQLLAFSRKQEIKPRVIDLNAVLKEIEIMVSQIGSKNIEVQYRLEKDLYPILINPIQLQQILLNLVVNARDAMPRGGKITIATHKQEIHQDFEKEGPTSTSNPYVVLEVSDTGAGIPEEIKEHIFEPFFTTKEEGKGTGMGLATVYGIVKQNHGEIFVESEVGVGTTFKIYFPKFIQEEKQAA